jgi:hypothetical protein
MWVTSKLKTLIPRHEMTISGVYDLLTIYDEQPFTCRDCQELVGRITC